MLGFSLGRLFGSIPRLCGMTKSRACTEYREASFRASAAQSADELTHYAEGLVIPRKRSAVAESSEKFPECRAEQGAARSRSGAVFLLPCGEAAGPHPADIHLTEIQKIQAQVRPFGVFFFNQGEFPRSAAVFYLLLQLYRCHNVCSGFIPNQFVCGIFCREAPRVLFGFVLVDAAGKVAGDASVKGSVSSACEDVDECLVFHWGDCLGAFRGCVE